MPTSALEKLDPQHALRKEPLTFEIRTNDSNPVTTCAGVLEFVAEEGTVGKFVRIGLFYFDISSFRHIVQEYLLK